LGAAPAAQRRAWLRPPLRKRGRNPASVLKVIRALRNRSRASQRRIGPPP
jgi:hypothetical protein